MKRLKLEADIDGDVLQLDEEFDILSMVQTRPDITKDFNGHKTHYPGPVEIFTITAIRLIETDLDL